jgi:hypothetical protein
VVFEGQLAFEGVEDRFDPLTQLEQSAFDLGGLLVAGNTLAGGADQVHAEVVEELFAYSGV